MAVGTPPNLEGIANHSSSPFARVGFQPTPVTGRHYINTDHNPPLPGGEGGGDDHSLCPAWASPPLTPRAPAPGRTHGPLSASSTALI